MEDPESGKSEHKRLEKESGNNKLSHVPLLDA